MAMTDSAESGALAGRHVVVTGASRGIGRGCAEALARAGASLTLVARGADDLETSADEIAEMGNGVRYTVADVSRATGVATLDADLADVSDLWGVVNSAGTNRTGPTIDYGLEDWDAVIGANLTSSFLVSRVIGRRLLERGRGGRIINLSSQMGSVGYPGRAAYCASKHGLNGLTRALAVEWAPDAITVNAVAPTFVETTLTRPMLADPAFRSEILRRIPIGRLGTVSEVAAAVAFLTSDSASMITGQILGVDGGWVAW